MWRDGRAALLGAIALCFFHVPRPEAMELLGQAGVLGEWELTPGIVVLGRVPKIETNSHKFAPATPGGRAA